MGKVAMQDIMLVYPDIENAVNWATANSKLKADIILVTDYYVLRAEHTGLDLFSNSLVPDIAVPNDIGALDLDSSPDDGNAPPFSSSGKAKVAETRRLGILDFRLRPQ